MTTADLGLIVSALFMGAAGGPHCAAMCGAVQAGVARSCAGGAPSDIRHALVLQIGRLVGYVVAGGALAGGMSLLGITNDGPLGPVWRLLHAAAIGLGLWLLVRGEQPDWLLLHRRALAPAEVPVRVYSSRATTRGMAVAGAIGVGWVAMPCGLLHAALLMSSLASTPLAGGVVMAAFGVASALALVAAQRLWWRLGRNNNGGRFFVRLAGVLLVASSGWALARDVGKSMGAAWCA